VGFLIDHGFVWEGEEWHEPDRFSCSDPRNFLHWYGRSSRKLRLFAAACCRRFWSRLPAAARKAVEAAERFADRSLSRKALDAARRKVPTAYAGAEGEIAQNVAAYAAFPAAQAAAYGACEASYLLDDKAGRAWQCALLREIFPPADVVVCPAWIAANDGAVGKIARAAYDQGAFDLLPVLADALEEGGYDEPRVLAHCRGPGPHVRGCWVVDALLDQG
jgi:hypothetical protein